MAMRVLRDYPEISIKQETLDGILDFEDVFGRKGAVHFEIGSGNGTFLVNQSEAMPEINFFGVEWASKYYRHAVDRLGRWKRDNVRIIRTDAVNLINNHIGDESIDWFHIYFPDPWPKARHNKRRFICKENLCEVHRILKPGGIINVATDHADYFEWMMDAFGEVKDLFEEVEFTRAAAAEEGEAVGTNFERKYIPEGRQINTFAGRKI